MTTLTKQHSQIVSDAELLRFVQNSVAQSLGRKRRVVRLERSHCDYHSSFAIEELDARFDDGTQLQFIFKNLSWCALLEDACRIRPRAEYEPEREVIVYRDILSIADLGTAKCYGALVDRKQHRYWLLLERVAGEELYKTGESSIWCDAAGWLARMHGRLASVAEPYRRSCRLPKYDAAHLHRWIEGALDLAGQHKNPSPQTATPFQRRWLAEQCAKAVSYVCELPAVIIHGEFYPSNIVVRQNRDQPAICPIDWETAAVGPALIDLAALTTGDWSDREKQALVSSYYNAITPGIATCGDMEDFQKGLRSCALLLAVKWLSRSSDWQPPPEHRFDWLAEAMRQAQAIDQG